MPITIYVDGVPLIRQDLVAEVATALDDLPMLRPHIRDIYLNGGWHTKRPPEVEGYREPETDIKGGTVFRNRLRNLETHVSVDIASREMTLSIIREMRRCGWTQDQADRMCNRNVPSMKWLASQADPEAEFIRCWEKAGIPLSDLYKRPVKPRKGADGFVSHLADREAVIAFIESNPGMGVRELERAGCGLTGRLIKGRIGAALKVLRAEGLVRTEAGPRRALYHFAVPVEVHEPAPFEARMSKAHSAPTTSLSSSLTTGGNTLRDSQVLETVEDKIEGFWDPSQGPSRLSQRGVMAMVAGLDLESRT